MPDAGRKLKGFTACVVLGAHFDQRPLFFAKRWNKNRTSALLQLF